MSTPENQVPVSATEAQIPTDVPTLQGILRNVIAKLMSHSQTVQELLKANIDLRAALHLAQTDKTQLESYIQSMLNSVSEASTTEASDTSETTPAVESNADTVSA